MVYLICLDCKVGLRICPGEHDEIEHLLDVDWAHREKWYNCFKCDQAKASLLLSSEGVPSGITLFDVNPQEAFAAINGLGLPGEQECSAKAVEEALLTKKIVKVQTQWLRNSHRCVIEAIEFEDGLKMYLGASAIGAIVYRMAPKHSYVREIEGG